MASGQLSLARHADKFASCHALVIDAASHPDLGSLSTCRAKLIRLANDARFSVAIAPQALVDNPIASGADLYRPGRTTSSYGKDEAKSKKAHTQMLNRMHFFGKGLRPSPSGGKPSGTHR